MKRLILASLLITPLFAMSADPAFNAGASFGKENAGAGTGSLKKPGAVTGSIPGYTANPPEKGYYGGVQGGDGGLANKGQAALQGSNAGQAVISSGNTNPIPTIDPKAPFITIGKNAEAGSEGVLAGTAQQCTETTVSKSTFENYNCSADVAVSKSCVRDTQITGHYEDRTTTKIIDVGGEDFVYSLQDNVQIDWSFPLPAGAQMLSGTLTLTQCKYCTNYTSKLHYPGGSQKLDPNEGITVVMNVAGQKVPDDGLLRGYWTNSYPETYLNKLWNAFKDYNANPSMYMSAKVTIVSTEKVWIPSTATPSVCDNGPGGKKTGSVCSIPGGDRQVVIDGKTQTIHSDCWQYTDTYLVSENTTGTCTSLTSNASCTKSGETCAEYVDGTCSHKNYTYQCQTVHSSSGLVCGGQYICKSGDCDDTNGAGNSGFDVAVAKLAGLASAADDVKEDQSQIDIKAFPGKAMSCRKAFAGFSNCCKDSGWGQDSGLAACNSDEMAIGKAKAKKITVTIGERCDKKVLGACIQKSQVYCVFDGKLARIIQEQGRRDQLEVKFGSGDSPNCRGITVPELQSIDFDKINFADFYDDLMKNQKIPDTAAQVKLIKDRIAAQVNQQGGNK